MWGNPYLRVLRSQLELYITDKLGSEHLLSKKAQTELRAIKKEIAGMKMKLAALEAFGRKSRCPANHGASWHKSVVHCRPERTTGR
jgi:hypothetical protein